MAAVLADGENPVAPGTSAALRLFTFPTQEDGLA